MIQTKMIVQTKTMVNFFHISEMLDNKTPSQQRLEVLIAHLNISVYRIAQVIGINETRLRRVFTKQKGIDSDILELLGKHWPELNMEWLITGRGTMLRTQDEMQLLKESAAQYGSQFGIRVVHAHHATEYAKHVQDTQWLSGLPISGMELNQGILYRDFEMAGNHMADPSGAGILPGDIMRGQYVSSDLYFQAIAPGNIIMCVTGSGIHIRIVQAISNKGIVLASLNPLYPSDTIQLDTIQELWIYVSITTKRTWPLYTKK